MEMKETEIVLNNITIKQPVENQESIPINASDFPTTNSLSISISNPASPVTYNNTARDHGDNLSTERSPVLSARNQQLVCPGGSGDSRMRLYTGLANHRHSMVVSDPRMLLTPPTETSDGNVQRRQGSVSGLLLAPPSPAAMRRRRSRQGSAVSGISVERGSPAPDNISTLSGGSLAYFYRVGDEEEGN